MLHTAGLGYDIFNAAYNRLAQEHGQPSVTRLEVVDHDAAAFRPRRQMGVRQQHRLVRSGRREHPRQAPRGGDERAHLRPLGMEDIAFSLTSSMRERLAIIHQREADGSLTPLPDLQLPPDPELHMGGHGLYASIGEYMKFIRMWLNDGAGPHGRVLKKETVEAAVRNGLQSHQKVVMLPGVIKVCPTTPSSSPASGNPGRTRLWSMTRRRRPVGRRARSGGPGSANSFFWIDRKNGLGGYWATQILPFADPTSFGGYMDFETAAYASYGARAAA